MIVQDYYRADTTTEHWLSVVSDRTVPWYGAVSAPVVAPTVYGAVISDTRIDWSWTSVPDAAEYEISLNGSPWFSVGTSLTLVDDGLAAGQDRTLAVRGRNAAGIGPQGSATRTTTGGVVSRSVLMVTSTGALSQGNIALRDILVQEGYTITLRTSADAENYDGIDVVVVTDGPSDTNGYLHPPVGIVSMDSWRELGMSPSLGYLNNTNSLEVVDAGSPLAAGVTGTFAPYLSPAYVTWATDLSANPAVVVTRPSQPGQAVVFAFEAGSQMAGRFATTRHVALGYHQNGFANGISSSAKAHVLAAVEWAMESTYVEPPELPPTVSGTVVSDTRIDWTWSGSTAPYETSFDGGVVWTDRGSSQLLVDDNLEPGQTRTLTVRSSVGPGPSGSATRTTTDLAQAGDHFLYSEASVTEFRQRMSGAGPFYSTGQGFYGTQANAPGDGVRAIGLANDFLANPSASEYYIDGMVAGVTPEPHRDTIRPMRAAWCYMTMPGHQNAAAWRDAAKANLFAASRHSGFVFTDVAKYSITYPGFQPNPIFAIAGWMVRNLKTYDMLGRDVFTSGELAELDRWFYSWANYVLKQFDTEINKGRIPGLATDDIYTCTLSGVGSKRAYNGGDYISSNGMLTNRSMSTYGSGALIANYLKYHGVTPATSSGPQPSYGWYTLDAHLLYDNNIAKAWVVHSLHPDGWCYDFHRALARNIPLGWRYAANEMSWPVQAAAWAARRGDDSLWSFVTTAGHINTAGVPTAGGFPGKSLRYGAWMHARYANNGWGRVLTVDGVTGSLADANDVRSAFAAAKVHSRFPSDTLLGSAWTRTGNNFPGYPSSPVSQGQFYGYDGEMGTYIGLIEVGGV